MALLDVHDLVVSYAMSGQTDARSVDGISLSLNEGEILGIVGETGAGKSVLLRTALGVFSPNERVESGGIAFRDSPLPLADDKAMRHYRGARIALIQSGQRARLDPVRRIGDQLMDVMDAHDRVPKAARSARARELLGLVGMPDPEHQLHAYPHELSGGMCQRVVIALALANSPELLMADEPTAGLDVTIQRQILDLFRDLVRGTSAASVLATRDLAQVAHYCDRVLILKDGKIVEQDAVRSFFRGPQTEHGRYLLEAATVARGEVGDAQPQVRRQAATAPQAADHLEPVLEVAELVKFYKAGRHTVHAVNGISFSIEVGKTLALVGESGSGKTTVGRCIAGLIRPTGGAIRLLGREVEHLSTRTRSKEAGLEANIVFQEPRESLNPRWTLGDSIEEPLRHQKSLDRRARAIRVRELLELVALPAAFAGYYPHQTTPGIQQRVAIARAIAVNPKLVILDEPTSALDMSVKAQVIDLLVNLQAELGLSYLFISHDMTAVKMIAHEIAIMYLGHILEYGPAEDIFASQVNPYARALLSSVLYPDPSQEGGRFRLEGEIPSAIELPPGCPLFSRCPLAQPRCNEVVPALERVGTEERLSACLRTDEILAAGDLDEFYSRETVRAGDAQSVAGVHQRD